MTNFDYIKPKGASKKLIRAQQQRRLRELTIANYQGKVVIRKRVK